MNGFLRILINWEHDCKMIVGMTFGLPLNTLKEGDEGSEMTRGHGVLSSVTRSQNIWLGSFHADGGRARKQVQLRWG